MSAKKYLELQEKHENLAQRVKDSQAELANAEEEMRGLNERLIDVQFAERDPLIKSRAELADKIESLKAIYTGLSYRRDVAFLAIYELREVEAAQENKKTYIKSMDLKTRLDQARVALRKFSNVSHKDLSRGERDAKEIELRMAVAQLSAEAQIAARDSFTVRSLLERAQNETQRIRQELNIQP